MKWGLKGIWSVEIFTIENMFNNCTSFEINICGVVLFKKIGRLCFHNAVKNFVFVKMKISDARCCMLVLHCKKGYKKAHNFFIYSSFMKLCQCKIKFQLKNKSTKSTTTISLNWKILQEKRTNHQEQNIVIFLQKKIV